MEDIRMSLRETRRYELLGMLIEGRSRERLVAQQLSLSTRQVRRLKKRVSQEGPKGVIHRSRGRPSCRRTAKKVCEQVVELYRQKYEGFNLTHYVEYLRGREKIQIGQESVRKLLLAEGLWQPRRRHPKHRLKRPRREHEGQLLQLDASIHAWLGFAGDERLYALVGAIDDATGRAWARFELAETTEGYFRLMEEVFRQGVPLELYSDRDSVFTITNAKERIGLHERGVPLETQFSRAMRELDVKIILAHSPQAKGRIERLWKTCQDRLYHELRLEGIKTLSEANRYLHRVFLPQHNRQFTRPASRLESAFRPTPLNWRRILCVKESRKLANDHTFPLDSKLFQVLPHPALHALRGKRVEICQSLRGGMEVYYKTHRLRVRPAPQCRPRIFPLPPRGERKGTKKRTFLLGQT